MREVMTKKLVYFQRIKGRKKNIYVCNNETKGRRVGNWQCHLPSGKNINRLSLPNIFHGDCCCYFLHFLFQYLKFLSSAIAWFYFEFLLLFLFFPGLFIKTRLNEIHTCIKLTHKYDDTKVKPIVEVDMCM